LAKEWAQLLKSTPKLLIFSMDPSRVIFPPLKDLNIENITKNTILINSLCEDERMKYLTERLVSHLHNFARETRLSTKEWMAGIHFLTAVGQICSDVHQVGRPFGVTK
jgi:Catechol dioxygenase N terminus